MDNKENIFLRGNRNWSYFFGEKSNRNLNYKDSHGNTPLLAACYKGDVFLTSVLLQNGADSNLPSDGDKITPLWGAASQNHLDIVKLLLDKGVEVNAQTKDGSTALYTASDCGHLDIVNLLLEHKADVNLEHSDHTTPLWNACRRGYVDITKKLVEFGANKNIQKDDGSSALFVASKFGRIEIVAYLLQKGAKMNMQNDRNCAAIHAACKYDHRKIVEILVAANPDQKDMLGYMGKTPLIYAAENGHIEIVDYLLKEHADPNIMSDKEGTALHHAAANGFLKTVTLLLKKKPLILRDKVKNYLPSEQADYYREVQIAQLLKAYEQFQENSIESGYNSPYLSPKRSIETFRAGKIM